MKNHIIWENYNEFFGEDQENKKSTKLTQLKGKKMNEIKLKGKTLENGKYQFAMIKKFYACYDKTGECYMGCFEADTDMRAIRLIEDAVKNPQSAMSKHPEDYRLDKLFEMDMRTGEIVTNEVRRIVEVSEYGKDQNSITRGN